MSSKLENTTPTLHCWADRYETESAGLEFGSAEWANVWAETHDSCGGTGGTCLLPAGHDGPHEWVPDSDIAVTFGPEASPAPAAMLLPAPPPALTVALNANVAESESESATVTR